MGKGNATASATYNAPKVGMPPMPPAFPQEIAQFLYMSLYGTAPRNPVITLVKARPRTPRALPPTRAEDVTDIPGDTTDEEEGEEPTRDPCEMLGLSQVASNGLKKGTNSCAGGSWPGFQSSMPRASAVIDPSLLLRCYVNLLFRKWIPRGTQLMGGSWKSKFL